MDAETSNTAATYAACLPVIIGLIFMLSCTKQPLEIGKINPVYATINLSSRDSKLMMIWVLMKY